MYMHTQVDSTHICTHAYKYVSVSTCKYMYVYRPREPIHTCLCIMYPQILIFSYFPCENLQTYTCFLKMCISLHNFLKSIRVYVFIWAWTKMHERKARKYSFNWICLCLYATTNTHIRNDAHHHTSRWKTCMHFYTQLYLYLQTDLISLLHTCMWMYIPKYLRI